MKGIITGKDSTSGYMKIPDPTSANGLDVDIICYCIHTKARHSKCKQSSHLADFSVH
ncbi:hypothetical protein FKM82_004154 [Ascaphus truei]